MRTRFVVGLLFSFLFILALSPGAFAQVAISVSVGFAPPPIPIYDQPVCPEAGYLWTPGYWAYDDEDGYYWVPGTWVEPPQAGFLWTPGYWGWNDGAYVWNDGYWGPEVGFYGGINYGFGYFGEGFGGGEWRGGTFFYNTAVVHVNRTTITNVYENRTVIVNNDSHVAFNGGQGGTQARPTSHQQQYSHEHHAPPVAMQARQRQEARSNPDLRASANHGKPPIAATAKAGDFKTAVVASKKAGGEYHAPPPGARGKGGRPGENKSGANAENRPDNAHPNGGGHASDMQPHQNMPPNGGNPNADKKYQQQQEKLDARQSKDREKLQKQQDKDHERATAKSYNDAQKQQMEQRHSQQTQQLEQKQATQQKRMEDRQAPKPDKPDKPDKH